MKKIISVFLLLICQITAAQHVITGVVKDTYKEPLPGANIIIKGLKRGTETQWDGTFKLSIPNNEAVLVISSIGFKSKEINIEKSQNHITIYLEEENVALADVTINAKTTTEKIKEKAFEVSVLETRGLKNSSVNLNTALKGVSGVNIRQAGGLGSDFEFSMNGLTGKQIKFFIDGIPMDHLGSSMSLNNFPPNLIDRAEVFKGVVPVQLGADALGGAINIITKQQKSNYLDVAYSFGSFNTHITSVLGQYYNKENGFTAKIASFFNYSDNNYTIDNVAVHDDLGNVIGTIDNVERFHDAYMSNMINMEVGVQDKSYADKLMLGALFSSNNNEIQHALDPQKPYGGVLTKERMKQISVVYENNHLLNDKLHVKLYGALSQKTSKFIDTVSKIYYWYKDPVSVDEGLSPELRRGEIGRYKSLFDLNDQSHILNSTFNYELLPKQFLVVNYTKNHLQRSGEDPLSRTKVPFSDPHLIDKNIVGISYDSKLFNDALSTSVFAKYFHLETKGVLNDTYKDESDPTKYTSEHNFYSKFGYGLGATYKFSNLLRFKTSFERAYRLPEGYELFGNGNFLLSNLELVPEESNNYNIGVLFNTNRNRDFRVNLGVNGFYRDAKNLIVLQAQTIFSQFLNKAKAEVIGFEAESQFKYKNWLLTANVTKQNITERNRNNAKVKIPNRPLFFGNIQLGYRLESVISNEDSLGFSWNSRYVDEYPLQSYEQGSAQQRKMIPSQFAQNFETNYSFQQNKYNISLLISNLTDARLYDNFNIQQPGRAYYVKFRYAIQ